MKKWVNEFKPLFSIFIFVFSLFSVVFLQMEERRLNYELLKLNKELKKNIEKRRAEEINLARATRPERIEKEVQLKTAFQDPTLTQIVHMSGGQAFERAIPRGVVQ